MDFEKIILNSAVNPEMTDTYSFKLNSQLKVDFFQFCTEKGLSPGQVMRELLAQFVEKAQENA